MTPIRNPNLYRPPASISLVDGRLPGQYIPSRVPYMGELKDPKLLVKMLGNDINLRILAILSLKDCYTREIALILGKDETDISRRLRRLEEAGLVKGEWRRIGDKNVRVYSLSSSEVRIEFRSGNIRVYRGSPTSCNIDVLSIYTPPRYGELVGRSRELSLLESSRKPIIHVWGLPGSGKTHLVARHVGENTIWINIEPNDTLNSVLWKIGFHMNGLGYNTLTLNDLSPWVLSRILSRSGFNLVIDDMHNAGKDLASYIVKLAHVAEGPRIYIISSKRVRRLPYWKGKVLEINLKGLNKGEFVELARDLGLMNSRGYTLDELYNDTLGLPGIVKAIASRVWSGEDLQRAVDEALKSYTDMLAGMLSEKHLEVLGYLSLARGPIAVDTICKVCSECRRLIEDLTDTGLMFMDGDAVSLAGFHKYLRTYSGDVARIGRVLASSTIPRERILGLKLLSNKCQVSEIMELVKDGLCNAREWPLHDAESYLESLRNTLSCRGNAAEWSVMRLERTILEFVQGSIEPRVFYDRLTNALHASPGGSRCALLYYICHMREARPCNISLQGVEAILGDDTAILILEALFDSTLTLGLGSAEPYIDKLRIGANRRGDTCSLILARSWEAMKYRLKGVYAYSWKAASTALEEAVEAGCSDALLMASAQLIYLETLEGKALRGIEEYGGMLEKLPSKVFRSHSISYTTALANAYMQAGMDGMAKRIVEKASVCRSGWLHPDCITYNRIDLQRDI